MQTFNIFLLLSATIFGLYQGKVSSGEFYITLALANIAFILIKENNRRKNRDKQADEHDYLAKNPSKNLLHD